MNNSISNADSLNKCGSDGAKSECLTNKENLNPTISNLDEPNECFNNQTGVELGVKSWRKAHLLSSKQYVSENLSFADLNMNVPVERQELSFPDDQSECSINNVAASTPVVSQTDLHALTAGLEHLSIDLDSSDIYRDTPNRTQSDKCFLFLGNRSSETIDSLNLEENASSVCDKLMSTFFSKSKTSPLNGEYFLREKPIETSKLFESVEVPLSDPETPESPVKDEVPEFSEEFANSVLPAIESFENPSLCETPHLPASYKASKFKIWRETEDAETTPVATEDLSICRTPHLPASYKASKFKLWKHLFYKNKGIVPPYSSRFITPINKPCASLPETIPPKGPVHPIAKLQKLSFPDLKTPESDATPNASSAEFETPKSVATAPSMAIPSSSIKLRRYSEDYRTPLKRGPTLFATKRPKNSFKICIDDPHNEVPVSTPGTQESSFSLSDLRRELNHIAETQESDAVSVTEVHITDRTLAVDVSRTPKTPEAKEPSALSWSDLRQKMDLVAAPKKAPRRRRALFDPRKYFPRKQANTATPLNSEQMRGGGRGAHTIDESIPCPVWMRPSTLKFKKSTKTLLGGEHKENIFVASPERVFPARGVMNKAISRRRLKVRDPSPLSTRSYKHLRALRF